MYIKTTFKKNKSLSNVFLSWFPSKKSVISGPIKKLLLPIVEPISP